MQKIVPHLWYDKEAKEAAELYTAVFPGSKITNITTLHDTPSGSADIVSFELAGQAFMAISAGPYFKFNPSVSFLVACSTLEEVDAYWKVLSEGGMALMELGEYPFSARFGWTQDRYGLSWQILHMGNNPIQQKITPFMMFVGPACGKAEEAVNFYTSVFHRSKVNDILRYGKGEEPDQEGTAKQLPFQLEGQQFIAMDSAHEHNFGFNEAVSLMVYCADQQEIDYYWNLLTAVPEAEQCGWLKDKYGLSWQITPAAMDEMMQNGTQAQIDRLTQAFLPMKKFDLAKLKEAYEGKSG